MKIFFYFLLTELTEEQLAGLSPQPLTLLHKKTKDRIDKIVFEVKAFVDELKNTYDGVFQQMEFFAFFVTKLMEILGDGDEKTHNNWWDNEINHYRMFLKSDQSPEKTLTY